MTNIRDIVNGLSPTDISYIGNRITIYGMDDNANQWEIVVVVDNQRSVSLRPLSRLMSTQDKIADLLEEAAALMRAK